MLQGLGGLYIAWSRRVKNSSSHFPSCNSMIYGAPGPTKSQVAQVQFTCCSWHPAMCFWAWRSWAFQSSHGAAGPKRVAGKEAKGLVKGKWLIGKPDTGFVWRPGALPVLCRDFDLEHGKWLIITLIHIFLNIDRPFFCEDGRKTGWWSISQYGCSL